MKGLLQYRKSRGIRLAALVLSMLLFLLFGNLALAEEQAGTVQEQDQNQMQDTVLKVAFSEVKGMSETDENGERHGIIVDYLNEIAKYTGWKYEYFDEEGEAMLENFLAGQYDLMGGTYYLSGMEEYFAYPDYNTGNTKAILLARRDDERIKNYDYRSMSGMTIGVYERANENIRRLEVFLESNSVDCTIKYYPYEAMTNGNLYEFLENGEVDLLLGNYGDNTVRFRAVAEFYSQPIYIVTTPGNQAVLDGINMAMEKILESDPDFPDKCYEKNYPDSVTASIFLNAKEKEYISQKKNISVAVVDQWHPMFCLKLKNELHKGIVPDVLEKVREFSGLEFTYCQADNYAEALEMVQQGKADILGTFLGSEEDAAGKGLALTSPYASLNSIAAKNKAVTFPDEGLVAALLAGREMPKSVDAEKIKYFQTISDALRAVNKGEADYFYGLSTSIEYEIQEHSYTNVVPNTLMNDSTPICFAVKSPAETELFTILNKAVNSLNSSEKTALVNRNLVSKGNSSMTLMELIYANPVMFVSVLGCIFLLAILVVIVIARSRVKTARMQSNLERAEASNRAKGEFLSRMSHEIRTPMNAIVGLSNLACMMEDVPDNVRENLYKIQSASQYLLRLISDILDMSRIESGKMEIAAEPFSLKQVIEELEEMLEADAKNRELHFRVEKDLENCMLIGDAIRLKQVLTNLVSNAFKFTSAGGEVFVCVRKKGRTQEQVTYCFQVIDSGVGISEENQKSIFEAFEQLGANYSRSQGTGLGLAISKNIVHLMGGELQLKSKLGKGSEFYFTASFPVGALEEQENESKRKQRTEPDGKSGASEFANINILLAEDNDLNAEIARELLTIRGAAVTRAENGREAADIFADSREGEFQAILMDIQMPVMDGLEACRIIRKMGRKDSADIPIIAMTANSFQEDADAAREAGMDEFVTKPVDVGYLYEVLRKMIK